jgi:golgi phosphoprotein 3
MLTLYEEIQLLSIHEVKGIFIGSAVDRLKPGLIGAILAELALTGRICISNNRRLHLVEDSPTNDPVLDAAVTTLKKSEKERKFGYWINDLNPKSEKLRRQITASLIQKGILTEEDDNLVWVIPSPLHPEIAASASTKYLMIQRLRSVVLAHEDANPREIAFLSLISACGLLDLVFLRDERKLASQYINELLVGKAMQDPILETVQEIDSAITSVVEED